MLDGALWGDSNFWVCGRNPMMWPFKCKLSACTFARYYLFFRIWENEIVTFGWNLLLDKSGSEKVERSLFPNNLPLSKGTSYCQWRFSPGFAVPWEFAFIAGSGMKSLFNGINSSKRWYSSLLCPSYLLFFICFFILLWLLVHIFFKSIAWNLLSRIPYYVSGLHVLVLPPNNCACNATRHEGDKNWTLNQNKC